MKNSPESTKISENKKTKVSKSNNNKNKNNSTIKKRTPQRPSTITTDIYVSRKSDFKGQLFRAKKLLLDG